jgi:hypothetical protein
LRKKIDGDGIIALVAVKGHDWGELNDVLKSDVLG